jgi:hypothetical protein
MDDQSPHKLSRHALSKGALGAGHPIAVEQALPLSRALADFLARIRARSSDLASLRLGVDVVEVLAGCARSLTA